MPSTKTTNVQPTVEEIIALLKKTDLPTVICEGSNDLFVYRRLEDQLSDLGVSVLPAGGRENVLQIFNRRREIPTSVRVVFVADRDTWVNTTVPTEYNVSELCLTSGYSIENDVIIDGELEKILLNSDMERYKKELKKFLDWYALALSRHLKDKEEPIKNHPKHVLDPKNYQSLIALRSGEDYPQQLRMLIGCNYQMVVRGKSLLSLLVRNTNNRKEQPKYTDKALLELVAVKPGKLLTKIAKQIEAVFKSP